jgi:hypothetical protein
MARLLEHWPFRPHSGLAHQGIASLVGSPFAVRSSIEGRLGKSDRQDLQVRIVVSFGSDLPLISTDLRNFETNRVA